MDDENLTADLPVDKKMQTDSSAPKTRILLLDDDPDEQELFRAALSDLAVPHRLELASNVSALFQLLAASDILPHVIFIDINMPSPNGLECLRELKAHERYKQIPVVMLTVSNREADIQQAYEQGAHLYVVKPYAALNLKNTLALAFQFDWRQPVERLPRNRFLINVSYFN